jgi:alpha-galactosidase
MRTSTRLLAVTVAWAAAIGTMQIPARSAIAQSPPATAQDLAAQDTTAQDTTAQDTTAQDTTAQDTTAQDVGNRLARTPPMGFNDWNAFGCNVSETLIKQTADLFVTSGLKDDGYTFVNIDDCWLTHDRDPATGRLVPDPVKFPDGIQGTADYVHGKGLKLGIYEDAGTATCAGFPGSLGHEQVDARTFADWAVDYLKYDNCNNNGDGSQADFVARYTAMRDALAKTGRPIVFSICEWGQSAPWTWAPAVGNLWRTTGDIQDNWESLKSIVVANASHADAARPGAWNDPDMLEVGNGGMTPTEYRTHFGLWAVMAAPLLIGTDLRKATPETLRILTNRDVIAVDQDRLGRQGKLVDSQAGRFVFSKPLANGDRAVALYNSTDRAATLSIAAHRIGLPRAPAYAMKDLWSGTVTETQGEIGAAVPAHGTVLFRVSAQRRTGVHPPATTLAVTEPAGISGGPGILPILRDGTSNSVTTTLTNQDTEPLTRLRVTAQAPAGWTITPTGPITAPLLRTGQSLATAWSLAVPGGAAPGTYSVTITSIFSYGRQHVAASRHVELSVLVVAPPPAGATPVSTLTWVSATNGWGPVEKDQSNGELALNDGNPITVAGTVYPRGLGIQPHSIISYYLGGACTSFSTLVGIDDEKPQAQSAIFHVIADGTTKADSGPITRGDPARRIVADVTGVTWLQLEAVPNSPFGDHADWVTPVLAC